jgi:predicted porin
MKKSLLATTALAALGAVAVAGPATAAEKIKLSVGGYMEQWFGYADNKDSTVDDRDGFNQHSDNEIHFKGSTTLDNGLKIGVNVQLEGETDGDTIDEQYAFVDGSFGRFLIGNENSAAYLMNSGLGGYGTGIDSGDSGTWIVGLDFARSTTVGNFARLDNDSGKITYFTPRVSGFQVGASYTPEHNQDNGAAPDESDGTLDDGFAIAANWIHTLGDVKVRAQAGYQDYGDDGDIAAGIDPEAYGGGLRLGFGGFSVAANYMMVENLNTATVGNELETFGIGVSYAAGPMGISLNYVNGVEENDGAVAKIEQDTVELGLRYKLGPGIEARGAFYYAEAESDGVDSADGVAVVGGLKIGF